MNGRFVFTGGPGAGKTAVLAALQSGGFYCAPDVARSIIKERLAAGLSPRPEPAEFAEAILARDVANHLAAPRRGVSYFDRGVIDALGMVNQVRALSAGEIELMLRRYRYNSIVFLFPPWQAIYRTDSERDQTFGESVRVFESVRAWYSRCGYQLREVPLGTVAERVAFVEKQVAREFGSSP